MITPAKFPRISVIILFIFCGIFSTPLFSMENNVKEDSVVGAGRDNFFTARVVEVVSGDTIKIERTGPHSYPIEEIKLDGIWSPKKDTSCGLLAYKFLKNMILNRNITVTNCVNSCKTGCCYNKIQAKIYLDGDCVNSKLISGGMVWRTSIDNMDYLMGKRVRLYRIGIGTCSWVEYPKHPILRARFQQWFLDEEVNHETPLN